LILEGQKTTAFQKRKSRKKHAGSDEESKRSFSVITHHGTLDLTALTAIDAQLWIRTLSVVHTSFADIGKDTDADKFEEYILEQWKRADVDRDNTVSVEECAILLRKMNCDLPKKILKQKIKGSSMNFAEYRDLMIQFMSMRPEVNPIIKSIKQQYAKKTAVTVSSSSNLAKKSFDMGELTVEELLFFVNTMQRAPNEPEITLAQLRATYLGKSKADTVNNMQFAKILDNSRNSVVDPVMTSRGCGGSVPPPPPIPPPLHPTRI
jgi:hypothetical protein